MGVPQIITANDSYDDIDGGNDHYGDNKKVLIIPPYKCCLCLNEII